MGFKKGAYAKVWKFENNDDKITVNLSTSRKNKVTGEYTTTFSGFVRVGGDARNKIDESIVNQTIIIGDTDVTTFYDKEKNKNYTTFWLYDFDVPDNAAVKPTTTISEPETLEDIPF